MERELGHVAADAGLRAFRYLRFPPVLLAAPALAALPAPAPDADMEPEWEPEREPERPPTEPPESPPVPALVVPAPTDAPTVGLADRFAPLPQPPGFVILDGGAPAPHRPPGMPAFVLQAEAAPPARAEAPDWQGRDRHKSAPTPPRRFGLLQEIGADLAGREGRPRLPRRRPPPV